MRNDEGWVAGRKQQGDDLRVIRLPSPPRAKRIASHPLVHHSSLIIHHLIMRRVAVTGIGLITPVGCGREAVWSALTAGRSGIVRIEEFDTSALRTNIAGVCRDFRPLDFFDDRE